MYLATPKYYIKYELGVGPGGKFVLDIMLQREDVLGHMELDVAAVLRNEAVGNFHAT